MAGEVASVLPGSAAQAAGLRPGDRLVAIDRQPCIDALDVRFRAAGGPVLLNVIREGGQLDINVTADDDLGLEFADALFDGVRRCGNHCRFCFVDQLPSGLRASLYVKDDDFRLSFLHGSYVTLTDLSPAEERRIVEQKLSPLYVSVQAVSAGVRAAMFGRHDDGGINTLERLARSKVAFHCQIVLCPGYNDGIELTNTLEFLLGLGRSVRSVAVVPVGLTRHRKAESVRACESGDARDALDTIDRFRGLWRQQRNSGVVSASDELHLLAGVSIPAASYYEGYPQFENGVGMVRVFMDEWADIAPQPPGLPCVVVTGRRFAPLLSKVLHEYSAQVLAVDSGLFGHTVTAAGLLSGADVVRALRDLCVKSDVPVLIPDVAVCREHRATTDGLLLDDWTVHGVAEATGRRVVLIPATAAGLAGAIGGADRDEIAHGSAGGPTKCR